MSVSQHRPGSGDTLLRGVLWGIALAFGTAIAGPVAPLVMIVAKSAFGDHGDDGGGMDVG